MSGSTEEGGILSPKQRLYDLLPAVYRKADEAGGYPLLALMQVFELVLADLEAGLPVLEEGWFIETCDVNRVPAIAALVGARLSQPLRPEHRMRVADTLALRRRVGLASAFPRLIRGASGWYALFAADLATPASAWPLPDLAQSGTPMPETAGQPAPRIVGSLRVWRLPVLPACGVTPAQGGAAGHFTFDPLGYERPLWNVANTALPMAAAPPVTALPTAITRGMLAADLARSRHDWPDGVGLEGQGSEDSLLYGSARGLAIRAWKAAADGKANEGTWRTIAPAAITAGALTDATPIPPAYPALLSGPIDTTSFAPGPAVLRLNLGKVQAEISLDLAPGMTMPALAAALAKALANPPGTVGPGATPSPTLPAFVVGAVGDRLAIVPCDGRTSFAFVAEPDPLALAGSDRLVEAIGTVPIDPALAGRLTSAQPGSVLAFSSAGRAFAIPLPLAAKPTPRDAEAIALALQVLLPDCFVCAAAGRVVIVPVPNPAAASKSAMRDSSGLAHDLGLVPMLVIDPETGTFAWPSAWGPAPKLAVDAGYAVSAEICGGSYPRSGDDGPSFQTPEDEVTIVAADERGGLDTALQRRLAVNIATAIHLDGAGTRSWTTPGIELGAGQSLRIVSAGTTPACLVRSNTALTLAGPLQGGKAGRIILDGLIAVASLVPKGHLDLALRDVTLIPTSARPALAATVVARAPHAEAGNPSGDATLSPTNASASDRPALLASSTPAQSDAMTSTLKLDVMRCRIGPIDLTEVAGTLSVSDSVLSALPEPAFDDRLLTAPSTIATRIARSTLMGRATVAGRLDAADTLFAGSLLCNGTARFDHCFVTELSFPQPIEADDGTQTAVLRCRSCDRIRGIRLRQCHLSRLVLDGTTLDLCRCDAPTEGTVRDCASCAVPDCAKTCPLRHRDQVWDPVGAPPAFAPGNRYPLPGFARLADDSPRAILTGATDRDVIGAGNRAAPTVRARDFAAALRENLLFGTGLDVTFEN